MTVLHYVIILVCEIYFYARNDFYKHVSTFFSFYVELSSSKELYVDGKSIPYIIANVRHA